MAYCFFLNAPVFAHTPPFRVLSAVRSIVVSVWSKQRGTSSYTACLPG